MHINYNASNYLTSVTAKPRALLEWGYPYEGCAFRLSILGLCQRNAQLQCSGVHPTIKFLRSCFWRL